jgi:hypothetical protein
VLFFLGDVLLICAYRWNTGIRWGYALYSSLGSLDLDCSEKLSIHDIKAMLCCPVLISMRSEVESIFEKSWMTLSTTNVYCMQYAAREASSHPVGSSQDPDDTKLTYKIFEMILSKTDFAKYMVMARPFGKKGKCDLISSPIRCMCYV